jgi:hypothetical protein
MSSRGGAVAPPEAPQVAWRPGTTVDVPPILYEAGFAADFARPGQP